MHNGKKRVIAVLVIFISIFYNLNIMATNIIDDPDRQQFEEHHTDPINVIRTEQKLEEQSIIEQNIVANESTQQEENKKNKTELVDLKKEDDSSKILNILNIIATMIGIPIAIFSLLIGVLGCLGFFEIVKWKKLYIEQAEELIKIKGMYEEIKDKAEISEQILRQMKESAADAEEMDNLLKQSNDKYITVTKNIIEKSVSGITSYLLDDSAIVKFHENLKFVDRYIDLLKIFNDGNVADKYYIIQGVNLYLQGCPEEAIEKFNIIIHNFENNSTKELNSFDDLYSQALFNKSLVLMKLGRNESALCNFNKIDTKNVIVAAKTFYYQGLICNQMKLYEDSIKFYDKAIEVKNDLLEAWIEKVKVMFYNRKKKEEAYKIVNEIFTIFNKEVKGDIEFLNIKGEICLCSKKYETAEESFETAIMLSQEQPKLWLNRGKVYIDQRKYQDAEKYILKAIEIKKDYSEAYLELMKIVELMYENYEYIEILSYFKKTFNVLYQNMQVQMISHAEVMEDKQMQEIINTYQEILCKRGGIKKEFVFFSDNEVKIHIAGSFNYWLNPMGTLIEPTTFDNVMYTLEKDNGIANINNKYKYKYKASIILEPGEHEFKFVINKNRWIGWDEKFTELGYKKGNDAPGGPNLLIVCENQIQEKS